MVITPTLRGLLGIEIGAGGRELRFAPQLPANWDAVEAQGIAAGDARYDLKLVRAAGRLTITITQRSSARAGSSALSQRVERLTLAPAFPLDAHVSKVTVQGRAIQFEIKRAGDVQRAEASSGTSEPTIEMVFTYTEGTDIYMVPESLTAGAQSTGLRICVRAPTVKLCASRSKGLGGATYAVRARTPYQFVRRAA